MGILSLVTLPGLGPAKLVRWLATVIVDEAQRQYEDEGAVRSELLRIQELYDAGELSEKDYDERESALLERLNAIRQLKAKRG